MSGEGRESQARLLRGRALGSIPQLLAVVRQLNERRARRSDRSADFRTLARWFAQAPVDEARRRLLWVAFGLHSSRHLTIDADTLGPVAVRRPVRCARRVRAPSMHRTTAEGRGRRPPTVALARAVEFRLSAIDDTDAAWERVQKRLSEDFGRFQDATPGCASPQHGREASLGGRGATQRRNTEQQ